MDFKTATDQLMAKGLTLLEIAEAMDAAYTTVRAWRLDPESSSHRRPPKGWGPVLARLARGRGTDLQQLARELEREEGV